MSSKRKHRAAKSRPPADERAVAAAGEATPTPERGSRWLAVAWAVGVSAVALALFVVTLAPTVTAEDSGELIAAAWCFGVPHPPGYPLWALLCGLFVHVFAVGEVAWRANLFSALCTAAAAGLTWAALRELGVARTVAASAALVAVWSKWTWSQSVITEVYGLNALLTAGILWCGLRWSRTRGWWPLAVASLLLGLGMSNHHIIAFAALAVIVWIIVQEPALFRRGRLILLCIGLFVAGLLPHLYLMIRAAASPAINWGDASTVSGLWQHVTRSIYGTLGPTAASAPRSPERFVEQLGYVGTSLADDLTPWVAAAALGAILLARQNRRVFWLVVLWVVFTGPLFALVANFDLDRVSRWLIRVFLLAMPLGAVIPLAWLLERARKAMAQRWPASLPRGLAPAVLVLLLAAGPISQVVAHWGRCNYREYHWAADHARNLLRGVAPNGLLFSYKDFNTFPLTYVTYVQQERPDVVLASYSGRIRPELLVERPADAPLSPAGWLIQHEHRPTYCTMRQQPPLPGTHWEPRGLLYQLAGPGIALPDTAAGLGGPFTYRNDSLPTAQDIGADLVRIHHHTFAAREAFARGDRQAALAQVEAALARSAGFPGALYELGVLLHQQGEAKEGRALLERSAAVDPQFVEPRWALFEIYKTQQNWEKVREQLAAIVEADPTDTRSCGEMGFLLLRYFQDRPGAIRYWKEALRRNPNLPQIQAVLEQVESAG